MTEMVWTQDVFSKGELSPYIYSRVTLDAYQKGLFEAQNVLTYPQGAAGKRFGTIYLNEITGINEYTDIIFEAFQYSNQCTYLLVITAGHIYIYLEGTLVADVTSGVTLALPDIQTIDTTALSTQFVVACPRLAPYILSRGNNSPIAINGFTSSTLTVAAGLTADLILPVTFTTGTSFPTTTPQVYGNVTYFIKTLSTTSFEVYSTAEDAKAGTNRYIIVSAGTAANVVIANTWTYAAIAFKNYPVYDFGDASPAYNTTANTFTLSAPSGFGVTITRAAGTFNFTSNYVGGIFSGQGGVARITAVNGTNQATVNIEQTFNVITTIPGTMVLIAEPAWSEARGWPSKCSSFQNRFIFANSRSLPNGLWLSVSNVYEDFNDSLNDDDYAISYYPSSDTVNFIRFIVPYRSLTVHTNSGIFSTPLTFEQAITPSNFSMTLQESTPATSIQPRGIDNQIIVVSGNDVHSMLWDGFNNAYSSSIASVANEQLIRNPHDEAGYQDLNRAGSRYVFIVNEDGSMAMFQTLISDQVLGFTPARLSQYYGNAYFRWVTSSSLGRAWFVTEREIATASAPVALTGATGTTFTAVGTGFSTTDATAITFTTTGSLPTTSPQIDTSTYYWVIGIDSDTFTAYTTKEDAESATNAITISAAGTNSNVIGWLLVNKFYIEELSFDTYVDCAAVYSGAATDTITSSLQTPNLARFNAQNIKINGDGFGFEDSVVGSEIDIAAHGASVEVSEAQCGFPIDVRIAPMPVAPPGAVGFKGSSLAFAQHIKVVALMFIDTIGGYIETDADQDRLQPVNVTPLPEWIPGDPPLPNNGVMQFGLMRGWNQTFEPPFTIVHDEPFDIKLIGIYYKLEV